jgi:hypothetical protein
MITNVAVQIAAACANCGKKENDDMKLKACAGCKLVKYCGRECQIEHRPRHKMACKERADELHERKLCLRSLQELTTAPYVFYLFRTHFLGMGNLTGVAVGR